MYRNKIDMIRLPGDFTGFVMGHNIPDYFPEDYVVLDLETTASNQTKKEEIIKICAIRFSDNIRVATYSTLVKPSEPINNDVWLITGITNEMLEDAEDIDKALLELKEFVGDSLIVGYCVYYVVKQLYANFLEHLDSKFCNWFIELYDLENKYVPELSTTIDVDVFKILNVFPEKFPEWERRCLVNNALFQSLKEKAIKGYKEPKPRANLEVTADGQGGSPFAAKHFYLLGTFEISTKYDVANLVIGLGATVDKKFSEKTEYVIVGMAEASALESDEMQKIISKKKTSGNVFILQEQKFLDGLIEKGYIQQQ